MVWLYSLLVNPALNADERYFNADKRYVNAYFHVEGCPEAPIEIIRTKSIRMYVDPLDGAFRHLRCPRWINAILTLF